MTAFVLPLIVRVRYVEPHLSFRNFASDNTIDLHFSVSYGIEKIQFEISTVENWRFGFATVCKTFHYGAATT